MSVLNKKLELIQWLSMIEDTSIIDKIIEIKKKESIELCNSISDEEKKSIELGIKDADAGNMKSHSEAKKLYEKWL